jgi:tungstate transport system ATP-binding protein
MDRELTPRGSVPRSSERRIEARGLIVERNGRRLVDVPELSLRHGEVLAVIGPNGAGKTSLLLQLALLERPSSGEVLFDGARTRGRELALRRRMAVVLQEPLLLDRTVAENVDAGMRIRGVPGAERRNRRERWLQRFGIESLAGRSSRTLSGGEAQRTSLARAFALEPEVLFLDEPFSALDQPTREALVEALAGVLAETQVAALVVTHDRDEAARLGDRVAVMIGGRVRQVGTPSEVFGAPADEEVASFVGVETIVPATVVSSDDGLMTLSAHGHLLEAVSDGAFARALVCLRPEDVSISASGEQTSGSARNKLAGRVTRIVTTGADARVEIDCRFPVIARVTRRSVEEMAIGPGTPVVATFKATAVHLIEQR